MTSSSDPLATIDVHLIRLSFFVFQIGRCNILAPLGRLLQRLHLLLLCVAPTAVSKPLLLMLLLLLLRLLGLVVLLLACIEGLCMLLLSV